VAAPGGGGSAAAPPAAHRSGGRVIRILDRYLLREWVRIFLVAALAFPLVVMLIDLAEKLDVYLVRDLTWQAIALAYLCSLPERIFQILPAAVLFATVFSLGNMARHSELTAAKASGRSAHRAIVPVVVASLLASILAVAVGELAPPATRRQLELLGELERREQNVRYQFVYRAEDGWMYIVRELNVPRDFMREIVLEREGTGPEYPTIGITSTRADYDSAQGWMLRAGRYRVIGDPGTEVSVAFDSMRMRNLVERPADLLAEPKKPEEMGYAELRRYADALERSGGDGRPLRVDLALKLAVPFTCIIITVFAAPLMVSAPRTGNAYGVAISLVTAIVFLVLVQLSRTIGIGGLVPPTTAAWLPNIAFGVMGLYLLKRAPT
jgi:lipopolysaccharide export system permease protein